GRRGQARARDLRRAARLSDARGRHSARAGSVRATRVAVVVDRPGLARTPAVPQPDLGQSAPLGQRADAVRTRRGHRVLRALWMARGGVPSDARRSGATPPRAEDGVALEVSRTVRVEAAARAVQAILRDCAVPTPTLDRRTSEP